MKKLILLIVLVQSISLSAQVNSRNGYRFAPKGTIRALLVFAEALNDTLDKGALGSWQPGQMPPNAGSYFDHIFTNPNSVSNYVTRYFYEASHDSLIILGDYINTLIQVEFTDITGYGIDQVIDSLNNLPGNDIITQNGYSINSDDFDMWTPTLPHGNIKINNSDDYIDMLIVVWRTNSKLSKDRNGGLTVIGSNTPRTIKSKQGVNGYVSMCTDGIASLIRHELAHSFLGGNEFHTGGAGAGQGTYLSDMGGYSLLGSWNKNLDFVNAWDKWRLGWKPAVNN